jgi:hypothetical protein
VGKSKCLCPLSEMSQFINLKLRTLGVPVYICRMSGYEPLTPIKQDSPRKAGPNGIPAIVRLLKKRKIVTEVTPLYVPTVGLLIKQMCICLNSAQKDIPLCMP